MVAAALGAAIGGALAPGYIRHRWRATVVTFCGALLLTLGTGMAVIFGIGHGDPRQFSLRLLAVLVYAAAAVGAALLRGLGAGE